MESKTGEGGGERVGGTWGGVGDEGGNKKKVIMEIYWREVEEEAWRREREINIMIGCLWDGGFNT